VTLKIRDDHRKWMRFFRASVPWLQLLILITIAFVALAGLSKLSAHDAREWGYVCDLPREVLIEYKRIALANPRGELVADYWKALYVDRNSRAAARQIKRAKRYRLDAYLTQAQQNNFRLAEPLAQETLQTLERKVDAARASCPELRRRLKPSERLKDAVWMFALLLPLGFALAGLPPNGDRPTKDWRHGGLP
jgi:hypothetical protein